MIMLICKGRAKAQKKGNKMNNGVVFKGFGTERGAINYIAKHFPNDERFTVEENGGVWMVIGR